jgi:hypothetical protein
MPESPAHPIETLIEARWVIPVEPAGTVLADHSVVKWSNHSGHPVKVINYPNEVNSRRRWKRNTIG